jgi:nicotinamidase-related amidase
MGHMHELPIPAFYDPANARRWEYVPDAALLLQHAVDWRARHALRPAADDLRRVHLVLIDLQKDFCFPQGTLYVGGRSGTGALDDNDRIARFIYRNLGALTEVSCTMDAHRPHQIFSPAFWVGPDGAPPPPNREVTARDIRDAALLPNPALADALAHGHYDWLVRQCIDYCEQLEARGRYRLHLWPPHCLVGSEGHALAGVIEEARLFHAYARTARAWVELKGSTPLTENYSALGPEVEFTHDGHSLAPPQTGFLDTLLEADAVLIAGQASSHCVKATIDDLLTRIEPALARKVYILRDCMSAVTVPGDGPGGFAFDFTDAAEAALDRFADAGMHVVESIQPMAEWLILE